MYDGIGQRFNCSEAVSQAPRLRDLPCGEKPGLLIVNP